MSKKIQVTLDRNDYYYRVDLSQDCCLNTASSWLTFPDSSLFRVRVLFPPTNPSIRKRCNHNYVLFTHGSQERTPFSKCTSQSGIVKETTRILSRNHRRPVGSGCFAMPLPSVSFLTFHKASSFSGKPSRVFSRDVGLLGASGDDGRGKRQRNERRRKRKPFPPLPLRPQGDGKKRAECPLQSLDGNYGVSLVSPIIWYSSSSPLPPPRVMLTTSALRRIKIKPHASRTTANAPPWHSFPWTGNSAGHEKVRA